jgi:hypothetical protein
VSARHDLAAFDGKDVSWACGARAFRFTAMLTKSAPCDNSAPEPICAGDDRHERHHDDQGN